jgi:hypothetical protein
MSGIALPADGGASPTKQKLALALKIAMGAFLVLFMLRFYFRDAVPYFDFSESSYGNFWPRRGWLLLHIIGGSLALLTGPFQFVSGLRRRYMTVHRWTGRSYLLGIGVGSIGATSLAFTTNGSPGWSLGLLALAGAWVITGAMAYASIRMRRISLHQEWMIRSYVVTFAFVLFRWLVDFESLQTVFGSELSAAMLWASWVIPLMLVEAGMQGRKLMTGKA